jgi:hypothetical protein
VKEPPGTGRSEDENMKHTNEFSDEMIADLPVSPALKILRHCDTEDDDEAIGWSEINRIIHERDWQPILELPLSTSERAYARRLSESGESDAFSSMDFIRQRGSSADPYRRKLSALKEERRNVLFKIQSLMEQINTPAMYQIFKYIRQGIIEPDDCEDMTMFLAGKLYVRMRELDERIGELKDVQERRRIRRGLILDQRILSCRKG